MHLLRNILLSAGSHSKKFFSDSIAYSLNNANLKRIEKAGWLLTKIFDRKY
ncbi:hypothetical protein RUMLAC_01881 [[Ruminococcus] lactaris ATCC 29176]|uniref:Uncharacterized protein n=1 Tax=[Ruminococcus] lactaris ATCC 29176 TaxID=471875 RepID=B5CQY2_9FIRM|nr:hypothetical protein RUMLAC_01881 [[Ruminococcus] lactaris ATCC 29176]